MFNVTVFLPSVRRWLALSNMVGIKIPNGLLICFPDTHFQLAMKCPRIAIERERHKKNLLSVVDFPMIQPPCRYISDLPPGPQDSSHK